MSKRQRVRARFKKIRRRRKQKGCTCYRGYGWLCRDYPHLGQQLRKLRRRLQMHAEILSP